MIQSTTPSPKKNRKHVTVKPEAREGRKTQWVVTWHVAGDRQRRRFDDEAAAGVEADKLEGLLEAGKGMVATATTADLASLALFRQNEPDVSLAEVIAVWRQHRGLVTKQILTSAICAEFLVAKSSEKSVRHVQTLRHHVARFEALFAPKNFPNITTEELSIYLNETVGGSPKTRKNHLITLRSIFNWAKNAKRCLPFNEPTAADGVEMPDPESGEHEVFTPKALVRLLAFAEDCVVVWLVLGAFAGVREAERCRMTWAHWKEDRKALVLTPEITKTDRRRSIRVEDNLGQWLALFKGKEKEKMVPYHNPFKKIRPMLDATGMKWVDNGLRAGYVSYHMELNEDMALTSKHSGHSLRVLEADYLNLVSKADAQSWFGITPQTVLDYCQEKGLPVPSWASRISRET